MAAVLTTTDTLKAEAIAAAVTVLTGARPSVARLSDASGEYIQITPTKAQAALLQKVLEEWMNKAPGKVRVDASPVFMPIVFKKAAPFLAGSSLLGFFLGKVKK